VHKVQPAPVGHKDCDSPGHPLIGRRWPAMNINHVIEANVQKIAVKTRTVQSSGADSCCMGFVTPGSHQVLCSWTMSGTYIPRLSDLARLAPRI